MPLTTYAQVLDDMNGENTVHLLLGNGFSIGCDRIFQYGNLFDLAVQEGLKEAAQRVFHRLGTNNFEAVMRLLDDGHWIGQNYELIPAGRSVLLDDLDLIKQVLVASIAQTHLRDCTCVADGAKTVAGEFIARYHNIFTTNYDLLIYWVNMHLNPPPCGDGFRGEWEDPNAETVVFTEHLGSSRGIFYLHGGLHLFIHNGEVRKHCWCRTQRALTELIREGLQQARYPLFVAEGSADRKLEQINRNGYLAYCLSKLRRAESPMVAYGLAFGASDSHIADAIADSKVRKLWVGLYGDEASAENRATKAMVEGISHRRDARIAVATAAQARRHGGRQRGLPVPLEVGFYDSSTARVWR